MAEEARSLISRSENDYYKRGRRLTRKQLRLELIPNVRLRGAKCSTTECSIPLKSSTASTPLTTHSNIELRGVRVHNLQNIDLDIPLGKFTVITGVSGSGKSSLAFDTLYAEGQRRYVESFSNYSRRFLDRFEKPVGLGYRSDTTVLASEELWRMARPFRGCPRVMSGQRHRCRNCDKDTRA